MGYRDAMPCLFLYESTTNISNRLFFNEFLAAHKIKRENYIERFESEDERERERWNKNTTLAILQIPFIDMCTGYPSGRTC